MGFQQYPPAAGGSGDVVGPASSTDNAVARFDSTTGKLIQNSTVICDDSGNLTGVGTINGDVFPMTEAEIATAIDEGADISGGFSQGISPLVNYLLAYQPDIIVTNSGTDPSIDGTYMFLNIFNGYPRWQNTVLTQKHIYFDTGTSQWCLGFNPPVTPQIVGEAGKESPVEAQTWTPSGVVLEWSPALRRATLEQVSVAVNIALAYFNNSQYAITAGDADSGGTGYRLLRVLNEM